VTLRSTDPNDPNIVSNTIIDGNSVDTVVRFEGGEGSNCVLAGLTITNGDAETFGGGVYCYGSSPTISNCVLRANRAHQGGGIYCEQAAPVVRNCILEGNVAVLGGGGMCNINCNSAPRVVNCTFSGNYADAGGAISNHQANVRIVNSILWENQDVRGFDEFAQIDVNDGDVSVSFSCIQGWTGTFGGIGNFGFDPCFVELPYWDDNNTPEDSNDDFWGGGDYHLRSQAGRYDSVGREWISDITTSICIDAGNPGSEVAGELSPNGNRINMGAYGGTSEASKSPIDWHCLSDMTNDYRVDGRDFAVFAGLWLNQDIELPADADRNDIVDSADLLLFTREWLWPE